MRAIASSLGLVVAASAAFLAGCAAPGDAGVAWNIPAPGSTWQIEQKNTGSYGKDVTYQMTRGESEWKGQQVVTLLNSANGATVLALPDGRWTAVLSRDGKPFMTYEPPIGYVYPLSVGKSWSTRHKVTMASGTSTDVDYNCRVEGREQVTVRAGTFETLRIVCETPASRDVSWTIIELGMHAKQEHERFANHPQGAGTQRAELIAVNLRR